MSQRQHIIIDPRVITLDLSARDLDHMATEQRRSDEAYLGAYAPDPEADYAEGVRDGYLLGLNDAPPIQWMPRTVSPGDQLIKLALFCLFIGVVTWAAFQ
jgi:hypothetical protein